MGRKQFLQSRAGNWSKVAMRTSLVLGNRFFVALKICSVLGINPAQEAARPAQQVLCNTV
jgi:hypothetical protein